MKPCEEEHLVKLLFQAKFILPPGFGYHVTHLRAIYPLFLCDICGKSREEGVFARARKHDHRGKLDPKGRFICQGCLERAASGRF